MTGNDGREIRSFRREIELVEIVQDVQAEIANLHDFSYGKLLGPGGRINVAAHGVNRGDSAQAWQDFFGSDVSGMNDDVGTCQRLQSFGAEQAMRIRDDSDQSCGHGTV